MLDMATVKNSAQAEWQGCNACESELRVLISRESKTYQEMPLVLCG